jgi:sucrose synthase
MNNLIESAVAKKDIRDFREFFTALFLKEKTIFLQNDIILEFNDYCALHKKSTFFKLNSSMANFIKKIQEFFKKDDWAIFMHRNEIGKSQYYRVEAAGVFLSEISINKYLDGKDSIILKSDFQKNHLHIDFLPFHDHVPQIRDSSAIGNGIQFMNRFLSSKIFNDPEKWNTKLFNFIRLHKYQDQQLLINDLIFNDFNSFYQALLNMVKWLKTKNRDTPFPEVRLKMQKMGFEAGWGNTVKRILDTMGKLISLINAPDDVLLEEFLSVIPAPLMSKIAIISPHGWFGQENVLGLPDTGGQVIYILDQVRALEQYLEEKIKLTGLDVKPKIIIVTRLIPNAGDTTCNQKQEKVFHTDNCYILRIPFVDRDFNIAKDWISRFNVWPYLERFADDAAAELCGEFQGRPDLIIGNYSDGNLVATLLSDKLDVIQCSISHALEKNKYLFSDLYWRDFEDNYHFSLHFIADILTMNKSDFIIASTHQEIIGTDNSIGQYESYQNFTMPGLFQVISGVNLFAPKFNVIPPGVAFELYFPYYEKDLRISGNTQKWQNRLFGDEAPDIFGTLDDIGKMPIFSMARLDRIKNLSGLMRAFGLSNKIRKHCNLIIAAGTIHIENSHDLEEQEEIRKLYALMEEFALAGSVRWLPSINKLDTGEVYRIMADHGGVFVQPALFEAFGLTILEAMVSGLPTFGPIFGGPSEIIQDKECGFLLNTSQPELIAAGLEEFIDVYLKNKSIWKQISDNGIKHVKEFYNWQGYSNRLINLAKLYGFWRYSIPSSARDKLNRYSDFVYHFLFKERAEKLL